MDPFLPQLIAVAQLDDRRIAITEDGKRLKRKLETSEAAVQALATALETLTTEQKTRKHREGALQDEIRQFEQRRQRAQSSLEEGSRHTEGAERQIEASSAHIDTLETELLGLMELGEAQAARHASLTAELATARAAHAQLSAELEPRLTELRTELAEVTEHRKPLVDALPREERAAYLQLVKLKQTALAPIKDKACATCSQFLPLQHVIDAKEGRRVVCAGCARWLYDPK